MPYSSRATIAKSPQSVDGCTGGDVLGRVPNFQIQWIDDTYFLLLWVRFAHFRRVPLRESGAFPHPCCKPHLRNHCENCCLMIFSVLFAAFMIIFYLSVVHTTVAFIRIHARLTHGGDTLPSGNFVARRSCLVRGVLRSAHDGLIIKESK